ncbi:MAG: hypothetical protein EOP42_20195, partial [Sphingobacteriaceae bacterium]
MDKLLFADFKYIFIICTSVKQKRFKKIKLINLILVNTKKHKAMSIKKDLLKKTKEYAEQAKEYAKDYADQAKTYAKDHGKEYAEYAKGYAKDRAKDYSSDAKKYAQDKVDGGNAAAVAIALIGGIVIGAALGILFAPEAGTDTRSNLGTSLQEFGNTVADKAQQGKEAITNLK